MGQTPPNNYQNAYYMDFQQNKESQNYFCDTNCATKPPKYLLKRNNIYYFCKRIGTKIFRLSLKSSNLEYCKQQRDRILKTLEQTNMDYKKLGRRDFSFTLDITPDESKGETEEQAKDMANKFAQQLLNSNGITPTAVNLNTIWDEVWENFEDYWKKYLKYKDRTSKISEGTIKNLNAAAHYLRLFCVKGVIPDVIYFEEVQDIMGILPTYFLRGKKWRKVTIQEIKDNWENSDYEVLNNVTINKHINNHKDFFRWLATRDIKYKTNLSELNPLKESDEVKRIEYSSANLKQIFNSDLTEDSRDFFNIALHTGLRPSEICNIKIEHVEKNCINIFDGKTENAVRTIPLHTNIKKMVNNRVKVSKNGYLIYNGNINAVGKKLNKILNQIIEGDDKSLYSFRKNFSQAMEETQVGEEKYKNYLLGHSFKKDTRHKHYNLGKVNMTKLKEIIDNLAI